MREPAWGRSGQAPGDRFALANERTFPAWIRSALALLAGSVLPVAAPAPVPRAVMRLRERAPSCRVVLHEAMVDRLLQMLHEEQLDLVVGTVPPALSTSGLVQRAFAEEAGVAPAALRCWSLRMWC